MRVLLSTIGSRGDVQPLVALASELRSLEHHVRLCVPPDFRDWIEGLGFSVTTIGPALRQATAPASSGATTPLSADRRRQLADASVATQFETIVTAARDCDIIVAATALQIAARSVAETMRIPYVFAAYAPIVLPSPFHAPPRLPAIPGQPPAPVAADNRELWSRDNDRFNSLFGDALNAHRASLGLPAVGNVRAHVFGDRSWLAADPTLAPWPDPDGSVYQTGAWILKDERALPSDVEEFLARGEAPVYFGFGSMRTPQASSDTMIRATRALGRRAIVSRGWADLSLPDDQADCLAIGEINVQSLFARVAAVVHHGGAGTTTAAALAGVPQVVAPQIYDQHYWAARVTSLGIGIGHAPDVLTVDSLAEGIAGALTPSVARGAEQMAHAVRRDGAHIAARAISELSR